LKIPRKSEKSKLNKCMNNLTLVSRYYGKNSIMNSTRKHFPVLREFERDSKFPGTSGNVSHTTGKDTGKRASALL
jgi:hypothetical protein